MDREQVGRIERMDRRLRESGLLVNARGPHVPPNAALSILLFFGLWGGSLVLGRLLVTPLVESLPQQSALMGAFALSLRKCLICGTQILAFFAWVRLVEKRGIAALGLRCKERTKAYWGGFCLGVGSIAAIALLLWRLGAIRFTLNPRYPVGTLLGCLGMAVFGWGVQSASEEIAIRGWLIPILGRRYGPLAAILLTGGVFGAIHLLGDGATALSLVNLTLSGVFFALYAMESGHIWGVCGLHLGWNFAQGAVFGLRVSGGSSIDSSLLAAHITGADGLTGGAFGPEGGAITTLFLTCAVLLTVLAGERRVRR